MIQANDGIRTVGDPKMVIEMPKFMQCNRTFFQNIRPITNRRGSPIHICNATVRTAPVWSDAVQV